MLLNPFRPCEGSPVFQEEYRGNYVPKVIDTGYGLQVVAPDTPYVAAAGPDKLYFIDTRFDSETAKHIKLQIDEAAVPNQDCVRQSNGNCRLCRQYRVANEGDQLLTNAIGTRRLSTHQRKMERQTPATINGRTSCTGPKRAVLGVGSDTKIPKG